MSTDLPLSFPFGDSAGSLLASLLFGSIACLCGFAVSRILRGFEARRSELPYYGTTRVARLVLGGLVTGGILWLVWLWLWTGFYRIELDGHMMTIRYYVPFREVDIHRTEVLGAHWEQAPKFQRTLVLRTTSGTFRSAPTRPSERDSVLLRILVPK